jgi:prepilin-type N-terminal cleavage/methylation domain-containing protein
VNDTRERGFTMAELMVTIAIVGILSSLAVAKVRRDPVADRTRAVTGLLQEARRKAIAAGAIRADVAATGISARTQLTFTTSAGGSRADLWQLVEDPLPASTSRWVVVSSAVLPSSPRDAVIWAVTPQASTDRDGTVPSQLDGTVTRSCYPDGRCDAMTVYLARRNAATVQDGDHYQIVVFPLSGIPVTSKGW